jgi:hypothetical protein
MESFLFAVPVTTNAVLPTQLSLVFVIPLRFVQFFVGHSEEDSLRAEAGSVISACVCGESE